MDKTFAHALLTLKALDDRKRTFTGTATTVRADKVGDVIEPRGAEFKLPLPLCWQHDTSDPIGWVRAARVTDTGIEIDGEVAVADEPASLKDRLDRAWAMLRLKLVQGLSIGFQPLEWERLPDGSGIRYLTWRWAELSPVTVACNGDCSVEQIKSIDQAMRTGTALPSQVARSTVRLGTTRKPGSPVRLDTRKVKGVIYLGR